MKPSLNFVNVTSGSIHHFLVFASHLPKFDTIKLESRVDTILRESVYEMVIKTFNVERARDELSDVVRLGYHSWGVLVG